MLFLGVAPIALLLLLALLPRLTGLRATGGDLAGPAGRRRLAAGGGLAAGAAALQWGGQGLAGARVAPP